MPAPPLPPRPLLVGTLDFFARHYGDVRAPNATLTVFPTQALETYQCADPTSRAACPTNPTTDVAGLMAVLPRLLAATATARADAQRRERRLVCGRLRRFDRVALTPKVRERVHLQIWACGRSRHGRRRAAKVNARAVAG